MGGAHSGNGRFSCLSSQGGASCRLPGLGEGSSDEADEVLRTCVDHKPSLAQSASGSSTVLAESRSTEQPDCQLAAVDDPSATATAVAAAEHRLSELKAQFLIAIEWSEKNRQERLHVERRIAQLSSAKKRAVDVESFEEAQLHKNQEVAAQEEWNVLVARCTEADKELETISDQVDAATHALHVLLGSVDLDYDPATGSAGLERYSEQGKSASLPSEGFSFQEEEDEDRVADESSSFSWDELENLIQEADAMSNATSHNSSCLSFDDEPLSEHVASVTHSASLSKKFKTESLNGPYASANSLTSTNATLSGSARVRSKPPSNGGKDAAAGAAAAAAAGGGKAAREGTSGGGGGSTPKAATSGHHRTNSKGRNNSNSGGGGAPAPKAMVKRRATAKPRQLSVEEMMEVEVRNYGDVEDYYRITEVVLGQGNFGKVRLAVANAGGAIRAIKTVPQELARSKATGVFKQEVYVMKMIDHPNLVMLHEIFEDSDDLHLVIELCMGGHLLDRIRMTRRLVERDAALVMQQILRGITYLHSRRIAHRDLKAENCLVTSRSYITEGRIKVGDFGLSRIFKPGEVWKARVGTPTHWAPEVLERNYTQCCDLWACGVIMYHAITGRLPYSEANDCEQVRKHRPVDLASEDWQKLHSEAPDLGKQLLEFDPGQRPTAAKASRHAWLRHFSEKQPDAPFKRRHLLNLQEFRSFRPMQRAALEAVTTQLGDREVSASRKLWLGLDTNGDGLLTIEELRRKLSRCRNADVRKLAMTPIFLESERRALGKRAVLKPFTYTEFVSATCARRYCGDIPIGQAAFRSFDKNGDGLITPDDLAISGFFIGSSIEDLTEVIKQVHSRKEESIDLEEFQSLLSGLTD